MISFKNFLQVALDGFVLVTGKNSKNIPDPDLWLAKVISKNRKTCRVSWFLRKKDLRQFKKTAGLKLKPGEHILVPDWQDDVSISSVTHDVPVSVCRPHKPNSNLYWYHREYSCKTKELTRIVSCDYE